jgi:hypothetical protein
MRKTLSILLLTLAATLAQAAGLVPAPKWREITAAGVPCVGCKVYFFESGTATPANTYTDAGGGTPNANPVVLDSRGEANIWLDPTKLYRVRLDSAASVTLWGPIDNVGAAADGFSYIQSGSGATRLTVQQGLRDRGINVKEFGAVDDNSTNSVTAFGSAFTAASGKMVDVPGTTSAYRFTAGLTSNGNLALQGDGGVVGGVPKTALKFSATGSSSTVQWDFSGGDSYPTIKDLDVSHVNAANANNGIGIKFGANCSGSATSAYYPFLDRLWVRNFDTGIDVNCGFFYGELRNVVAMDNLTYGLRVRGALLNGTAINGGQFSRNGTGLYLEDMGSNTVLRSTFREGNTGTGLYIRTGHAIVDEGSYQENNGSNDIFSDVIYPSNYTKYMLIGGYFDALQGSGLARVRSSTANMSIYALGNHFVNSTSVPPFQFDVTEGLTHQSVFIHNQYRTATISNLSNDKGLFIIDRKHPIQLFTNTAPTALPVQRGAIFYETDSTTQQSVLGYRVTTPGYVATVPTISPTASTTNGSNAVTLSTNTGWRVTDGDWICVVGVTFGGSTCQMVVYTEPGPILYMNGTANATVSGAAVTYQTAQYETIPAPGVVLGAGAKEISATNLSVASGASVQLFQFTMVAGDKASVTVDAVCGQTGNNSNATGRIARVILGHDGGSIDIGTFSYIGSVDGVDGATTFTLTASEPVSGTVRFFVTQATGNALTCGFSAKIIHNKNLPANLSSIDLPVFAANENEYRQVA